MSARHNEELASLAAAVMMLEAAGTPEVAIAPLRAQLAAIQQHIYTAGGDDVLGDKTVEGDEVRRDKIAGDQVNIETLIVQVSERLVRDLKVPGAPADLAAATEEHLRCLVDRHRYLSLKGMGVSDRVPLRLPLLDLHVPLRARLELPEGETWRRLQLAGRALEMDDAELLAGRLGEPQPLLDLLQRHDGLVILGDPGAGKTTFLKYLALQLALGQAEAIGLGDRLPVLVPLSAYANALRAGDVRLDDFIAAYLRDLGSDLPMAALLQQALRRGAVLALLDGLDEVADAGLRHTVVERVVDFYTFHRRAGNKFVLTSRIVGYRAVRPTAAGLAECTLVDFEDEEIEEFVGRWTEALERQASGAGSALAAADAVRERAELLDAVQRNPGVRRLAANPLLLTILALMKRQGVTLPERRVELYDQYVRTLLSTWNRARGLAGRAPARDLDPVQTIKVLAPLALWMHEVNPGVGLVRREALRRQLEAIFQARGVEQAEDAAARFLEDAREHAGLLLERGAGEYGFIHLTFEEYLAGTGIALLGQQAVEPIVEAIAQHVGDPAWREVSLLAIGYLAIVQQREEAAGAVVEALVQEQPGPVGEAVVLAGEAVLDAGVGSVPAASRERVVVALVETMQAGAVPAVLRRRAGLALGRLGWLPEDLDEFVEVPAGEFLYGDDKERRRIPYTYWIAKYPVAKAQFARFVADGGYEQRQWWSEGGWSWRVGTYDSKAPDWLQDWLRQRPPEQRHQPFGWDDHELANPLFPVIGVSWFEVEAYANWLNSRLDALSVAGQGIFPRPAGYAMRLASELEWERAARGVDGRTYPWGAKFSAQCANTEESSPKAKERMYIGTTAVCTYPQGKSPIGAWDMSGNVWEWTRSPYAKGQPDMVLRGGGYVASRTSVRCASRDWRIPGYFFGLRGVRVVVSLANSGS
jgi:formylglycine-generating enzyme required for sulfatase activity